MPRASKTKMRLSALALLALGPDATALAMDMDAHAMDDGGRGAIDPMFAGCGRTDLDASYQYRLINERMHEGMAINFTGNAEYDLTAGMIPHHAAATEMCDVYLSAAGDEPSVGIALLCYNIKYGAVKWGVWQSDFSQPEETKQMLQIIEDLGMTHRYESGCSGMMHMGGEPATEMRAGSGTDGEINMGGHGGHDHGHVDIPDHDMTMRCGQLDLDSTKEYIAVNMDMHNYMALNFTGNNEIDFLLGMIPHHEGAISMCDIYYKHWSCAPDRVVCENPLSPQEVQEKMSAGDEVDALNAVHHICTGHIMETQPEEVEWMRAELERISPESLAAYDAMKEAEDYPCPVEDMAMVTESSENPAEDMSMVTESSATEDGNDSNQSGEGPLEEGNLTSGAGADTLGMQRKDRHGILTPPVLMSLFGVTLELLL